MDAALVRLKCRDYFTTMRFVDGLERGLWPWFIDIRLHHCRTAIKDLGSPANLSKTILEALNRCSNSYLLNSSTESTRSTPSSLGR